MFIFQKLDFTFIFDNLVNFKPLKNWTHRDLKKGKQIKNVFLPFHLHCFITVEHIPLVDIKFFLTAPRKV